MSNSTKIAQVSEMTEIEEVREAATELGVSFSGNSGIDTIRSKVLEVLKAFPDDEKTEEDTGPSEEELAEAQAKIEAEAAKKESEEAEAERVKSEELATAEALKAAEVQDDDEDEEPIQVSKVVPKNQIPTEELLEMDPNEIQDPKIRRQVIRAKAMRLHRVHITNLDPSDSTLDGSIVTVVNKYTGKVSKFIPFGEAMENGYHVEEILLNTMKTKKYPLRKEIKNTKFGVKKYKTVMVPKYAIKELEPLTKAEIKALADRQSAANAIG